MQGLLRQIEFVNSSGDLLVRMAKHANIFHAKSAHGFSIIQPAGDLEKWIQVLESAGIITQDSVQVAQKSSRLCRRGYIAAVMLHKLPETDGESIAQMRSGWQLGARGHYWTALCSKISSHIKIAPQPALRRLPD